MKRALPPTPQVQCCFIHGALRIARFVMVCSLPLPTTLNLGRGGNFTLYSGARPEMMLQNLFFLRSPLAGRSPILQPCQINEYQRNMHITSASSHPLSHHHGAGKDLHPVRTHAPTVRVRSSTQSQGRTPWGKTTSSHKGSLGRARTTSTSAR